LNLKTKEEYHSLGHYIGRDEVQTVDFFIQRLDRAREPFLGIYYSFAAHLPYFDYVDISFLCDVFTTITNKHPDPNVKGKNTSDNICERVQKRKACFSALNSFFGLAYSHFYIEFSSEFKAIDARFG
jgi:hypothetical protein